MVLISGSQDFTGLVPLCSLRVKVLYDQSYIMINTIALQDGRSKSDSDEMLQQRKQQVSGKSLASRSSE